MKYAKMKTNLLKLFGITLVVFTLGIFTSFVFAAENLDVGVPNIISVSPANNQLNVATHDTIVVRFDKEMDKSTINKDTFTIIQRTTPLGLSPPGYRSMPIEGVILFNGVTATFIPNPSGSWNPLQPSQIYGNVFTATVTTGVKDIEGNPIPKNYVWSFTTGNSVFNTDSSTSSQIN